ARELAFRWRRAVPRNATAPLGYLTPMLARGLRRAPCGGASGWARFASFPPRPRGSLSPAPLVVERSAWTVFATAAPAGARVVVPGPRGHALRARSGSAAFVPRGGSPVGRRW